jgi:L-lactate dehydrogenase
VTKVTIVGAGAVGAAIAYAAQIRGVCQELALYDLNQRKVSAEVLDLNHGMQFTPMARIIGGDDLEVARDSDIIVITAGAKQKPGQTRLDLAAANVEMCRRLVPALVERAPDTVLLLVTNPVDLVTLAALQSSGLPSNRVFGSGTVLDSSRLRYLIAERTGVAVQNVHAYIAGEHGDSEVPLWSSATIGGVSLPAWDAQFPKAEPVFDAAGRRAVHERVVGAAYEIIDGKGATSLAIGLAVSRILEAILKNERRVLPVSSLLDSPSVFAGLCLSMPSIVGRDGVIRVLDVPLDDTERAALTDSAAQVRTVARDLGLHTD